MIYLSSAVPLFSRHISVLLTCSLSCVGGEARENLKGNPTLIQIALTFCWVLYEENLNVTLMSQPCDRAKVIHSWKYIWKQTARAARLSDGCSLRSGKPFMGHAPCSENPWKPLTKKMPLPGWYTSVCLYTKQPELFVKCNHSVFWCTHILSVLFFSLILLLSLLHSLNRIL